MFTHTHKSRRRYYSEGYIKLIQEYIAKIIIDCQVTNCSDSWVDTGGSTWYKMELLANIYYFFIGVDRVFC